MSYLDKFYALLNKLFQMAGEDGLKHIVLSALLTAILSLIMPTLLAVFIVAIVGIAKEVFWDEALEKGEAEWKDLVCDAIGILIGAL